MNLNPAILASHCVTRCSVRSRGIVVCTIIVLIGLIFSNRSLSADPPEFGWNVVFAKSADSKRFVLIKPFSSRNSGVPHEFSSFDAMLENIPKSDHPRYFSNFDQNPPGFSVEGLILVPLSLSELNAIEKHVGAKCFQRESDTTHPTLEIPSSPQTPVRELKSGQQNRRTSRGWTTRYTL